MGWADWLVPTVGGIGGFLVGGPAGAAAGATLGAGAGSALSDAIDPPKKEQQRMSASAANRRDPGGLGTVRQQTTMEPVYTTVHTRENKRPRDPVTGAVIRDPNVPFDPGGWVTTQRQMFNPDGTPVLRPKTEVVDPYQVEEGTPEWASEAVQRLQEMGIGRTPTVGRYVAGGFRNRARSRDAQMDLANRLLGIGTGEDPTVAERLGQAAQDRLRAQTLSALQAGAQDPAARRAALMGIGQGSAQIAQQTALQAAQERERILEAARMALGNVGIQDVQALSPAITEQGQGRQFITDTEKLALLQQQTGIEDKLALAKMLQGLDALQEQSRLQELGYATQQKLAEEKSGTEKELGYAKLISDLGTTAAQLYANS